MMKKEMSSQLIIFKYINYYELLLKFNWSMENFVILLYNIFEFINMGEIL